MFNLVKVESEEVSVQIVFEEVGFQSVFEDGVVFCCPDLYQEHVAPLKRKNKTTRLDACFWGHLRDCGSRQKIDQKHLATAQSLPSPAGREVLAHTWLYHSGIADLNPVWTTTPCRMEDAKGSHLISVGGAEHLHSKAARRKLQIWRWLMHAPAPGLHFGQV